MLRSLVHTLGLLAIALVALPSQASAFCTRSVERTPVAFSQGGDELLVEVLERNACFPDGVAMQRLEVIRLGDLAVVDEIELVRGSRDWNDASTWEARDAARVNAEIADRRESALRELGGRFPNRAVAQQVRWYDDVLVSDDGRRLAPAQELPAADPYASELPEVRVFVAQIGEHLVAVGLVQDQHEDHVVSLRSASLLAS